MTAEAIAGLVGVILSVVFEYVPGVRGAYEKLEPVYKKLVAVGLGALAVGVTFGLSCGGLFGVAEFTCDADGAQVAVQSFLFFVLANQTTYALAFSGKTSQARLKEKIDSR